MPSKTISRRNSRRGGGAEVRGAATINVANTNEGSSSRKERGARQDLTMQESKDPPSLFMIEKQHSTHSQ